MEINQIAIKSFGPASLLNVEPVTLTDELGEGEVRVKVQYSGINFADIVMRLGQYREAPPKPFVPGYEISGVVEAVGSAVTRLKVGDEVMAGTRFGGYSSHVVLPEWQVMKRPETLTLQEAAALPVNYITAHIALHEFARVRAGDKVLLDCATGGVGVMAMQICKEVGAECIGLTTSAHKKEFIASYGARPLLFEELEKSKAGDFTFILNSSGGASVKDQYERLSKSGLICCIGMQGAINNGASNLFAFLKTVLSTPWYPLVKLVMQSKSVGGFNALKYFDDKAWLETNLKAVESCPYKTFYWRCI
jgi:NADPH:quinone reductase-like Zn-dependent oxidoreductase